MHKANCPADRKKSLPVKELVRVLEAREKWFSDSRAIHRKTSFELKPQLFRFKN